MPHPLEQRLASLRVRVRRLGAIYGLSWTIGTGLAAIIAFGMADYLIRFQDRGIRLMSSLAVLAVVLWTAYRCLYRPLAMRLGNVDLALRLERRFPAFENRLLSAVEFLRQPEDDPLAGSPALRRAVISQATAQTEQTDFYEALDRRPPVRAAVTMLAVCLAVATLVVLDPLRTQIALARLANPFNDQPWPQQTHLTLRQPITRVARGQPFEVEVIDAEGARLPQHVRIHYRTKQPDGTAIEEVEPMRLVGGAMVGRRENVLRPFSFRVEGGDDNAMPWNPVELSEPPAIDTLSIDLLPPPYTGLPPDRADRHIRALVGTALRMTATTNKPLRSAILSLDDGAEIPAKVSHDGYRFTVGRAPDNRSSAAAPPSPKAGAAESGDLLVEKSSTYHFRLLDREGLTAHSERWEIRAVPDAPPVVSLDQPAGDLFVTPRATLPLHVTARDDLAIREVSLVFRLSQPSNDQQPQSPEPAKSQESSLPLYQGPSQVATPSAGAKAESAGSGEQRPIDFRWDLGQLELSPGTQILYRVTATDYRPQTGSSTERRLSVIAPEELQDRLSGRVGAILAELARVLKMQQTGRFQVNAVSVRLEAIGALERLDIDHLQAAELNQRQVNQALANPREGVPSNVLAILADLDNNRIDNPELRRRMNGLLAEIQRLDREHLPMIGAKLTTAIKAAQAGFERQSIPPSTVKPAASPPMRPAIQDSLANAAKHQDAVIAALERMIDQLSRWDNYRRFHRDLSQLLKDQEGVALQTKQVAAHTLTKELRDLKPQELAELKVLSNQQSELARRFERTLQELGQAAADLRESDPLAAAAMTDALAEARRRAIGAAMRETGPYLEDNQIGQVVGRHRQIIEDLQEVLDILSNRREHELSRLLRKLDETEADLQDIERRQAELSRQMQQIAQQPEDARPGQELRQLARQQQTLHQETESSIQRLQRLLADRAANATTRAAAEMLEAARCADQGDAPPAAQHAADALESLSEARRELADSRRHSQEELASEQLTRLGDSLKQLRARQQQVLTATQRYHALQAHQQLTRDQASELIEFTRQQKSLQAETHQDAESLDHAPAFQLALAAASRHMGVAAAMLDRQQTGPPTQHAQQEAITRLALVLEALKPQPSSPDQADQPDATSAGASDQDNPPPSGPRFPVVAQLRLLKSLQQQVNTRTAQLAQEAANTASDDNRDQYISLSEEQGQLARLVLQLLRPVEGNPATQPALPGNMPSEQPTQPNLGPNPAAKESP